MNCIEKATRKLPSDPNIIITHEYNPVTLESILTLSVRDKTEKVILPDSATLLSWGVEFFEDIVVKVRRWNSKSERRGAG